MIVRAGGHVLRGGRWVCEVLATAESAPLLEPHEGDPDEVEISGSAETPAEMEPAPEPGRVECLDCGKPVAVNKSGSLRKHTCVIDAAPPQVTFGEDEDDG